MAAALVLLHLGAAVYVDSADTLYDQGGPAGLLWWLTALWLLPAAAAIVLAVSIARHLLDRDDPDH